MYKKLSLLKYLDMIGAATPTPGGGSVSAYTAALASALGTMTAGITMKKVPHNSGNYRIIKQAKGVFHKNYLRLLELAEADSLAYDKVSRCYKLPHYILNRRKTINNALKSAAQVPYQTMYLCQENLREIVKIRKLLPAQLLSDINVAVLLTKAAYHGARFNVIINVESMTDKKISRRIERDVEKLEPLFTETILWLDDWM
ncbi:MAG: cyclodeaminase/cyclohydrolase family protein [Planctomycetota bacterium]